MRKIAVTTVVRDAGRLGGGMASVARPLHTALTRLGANASFVSGNEPADATNSSVVVTLRGEGLRGLPPGFMNSAVHIHGIWTIFEYRAWREARRRGGRIVISPHGALEPWAFRHKRAKKTIAWWAYQKRILQDADLLIVNSEQERRALRDLGLGRPIATIPNGVDVEGLSRAPTHELPRDKIVLFFSRLDPKKGILDLIEAWGALLDRNGHSLHIQGYGEPAYAAVVAERIRQAGEGSGITLLPPVFGTARWAAYERGSVFVLPTYSENFGITVAEALMAGLPVITTRATPWGDLASEGLGWIIDNDATQLRDALQAAVRLTDTQLASMRAKARAYAASHFAWDVIAARYIETYEWLLDRSLPSPAWVDEG